MNDRDREIQGKSDNKLMFPAKGTTPAARYAKRNPYVHSKNVNASPTGTSPAAKYARRNPYPYSKNERAEDKNDDFS